MDNFDASKRLIPQSSLQQPFRRIGTGTQYVYCYYFPYVRKLRLKTGARTWPCKIGKAVDQTIEQRVAQQIHQESCFEKPIVGFEAETEDADGLEREMREWFPKSRKLNFDGEERIVGVGTEWVEANLFEVRSAYRAVIAKQRMSKWYHWPARIWLFLTVEFKAWSDTLSFGRKNL